MPDDGQSNNPFVRWKQNVDAHVAAVLQGLLGLPSVVSRNLNLSINPSDRYRSVDHDTSARGSGKEEEEGEDDALFAWMAGTVSSPGLAQEADWYRFAEESPYSPLNLDYILPPLIPRDVPREAAHDTFTYKDAFEDLLAASSGQPLMDLRSRMHVNSFINRYYGIEESGLWVQRLQRQGLWDAWFPLHMYQPLARPAPQANQERSGSGNDWKRDAARVFREDETNKPPPQEEKEPSQVPDSEQDQQDRQQPWTEEDLFSTVNSAFAETEKSFKTFMRLLIGDEDPSPSTTDSSASPAAPPAQANPEPEPALPESDGRTTTTTTDRYVDRFGYLHVKTTKRTVDAEGKEVASDVRYSIRPAAPEDYPQSDSGETKGIEEEHKWTKDEERPAAKTGEDRKESGWFWK